MKWSTFSYWTGKTTPISIIFRRVSSLLPVCNLYQKSNEQLNYSKQSNSHHYKVYTFCHTEIILRRDCDVDATALYPAKWLNCLVICINTLLFHVANEIITYVILSTVLTR